MRHCKSCGEKKRLRWPKYNPQCCTKDCAAHKFLSYAGVGLWEGAFCLDCGDPEPDCRCGEETTIGPKMLRVLIYVNDHPGCTKLAAGNAATPFGRMYYRYAPVNRCIAAGFAYSLAGKGNSYKLYLTREGLAAVADTN